VAADGELTKRKKKKKLENTFGVVGEKSSSDASLLFLTLQFCRIRKPFFFFLRQIIIFYYGAGEFPILPPLPSPPFWSLFHSFFFCFSKSHFSFQRIHRTKKGYCVEFLFFSLRVLSLYIYTHTRSSVSLQPTTSASLHLCLVLKVCDPSSFLFFESVIFMPPNPTRKKKPNDKIKQKQNKTLPVIFSVFYYYYNIYMLFFMPPFNPVCGDFF